MIDLHSHPLPDLDDGARDLAAGVELVRAAAQAGVSAIAATPHVREDYPTTADAMEDGVRRLRSALGAGAQIEVTTGAEVASAYLPRLSDEEVVRLTLGGSGRYLLVELPDYGWSIGVELSFQRLATLGIRPLIAHPERNDLVQERPARLEALIEAGALVQVTARATDARAGRASSTAVANLLRLGLVHVVASDAHGAVSRTGRSPWQVDLDDGATERLCVLNPASILRGEEVVHERRRGGSLRQRLRRGR